MLTTAEILANRFGYGRPPADGAPWDVATQLAGLAGPDLMQRAYPAPDRAQALAAARALNATRKAHKGKDDKAPVRAAKAALDRQARLALRATLARALDSDLPFRERLVAFWANHFCTRARTPFAAYLPALMVDEVIRPHLAGRFGDLLFAATTHPAMVLYLDQQSSFGPNAPLAKRQGKGLNENLAREVLELHSLGVGAGYTQADVRQMAELLTGLTFDLDAPGAFDARRAEPGAETVLGKEYDGQGLAPIAQVLHDLALRPETARHIATKLARHFLADVPPAAAVDAMAQAYLFSGGDLAVTYGALLSHPLAGAAEWAKVRWPQDYLVTALGALGVTGAAIIDMAEGPFRRAVPRPLAAMGMPWLAPPGPNGFAEAAEDWINPPFLAARIAWAMQAPRAFLGQDLPDPRAQAQAALGGRASPALLTAIARAETQAEALGLLLASTEMNRR